MSDHILPSSAPEVPAAPRPRWQCSGCRWGFLDPWQKVCPACGRSDYWTGSVYPDAQLWTGQHGPAPAHAPAPSVPVSPEGAPPQCEAISNAGLRCEARAGHDTVGIHVNGNYGWISASPAPAPAKGPGEEQLAEWERLAAGATPGPWDGYLLAFDRPEPTEKERMKGYVASAIDGGSDAYFAVLCEKPDGPADVCHSGNGPTSEANAQFIAAARTAVPALVAEVRALRAAKEGGR